MKKEDVYMKLFDFSRPTYYKWKREENKALQLISKYFDDRDLIEFLETGKIEKFEIKTNNNKKFDEFVLKNAVQKIEKYIEKPGIVAEEDKNIIEKLKEALQDFFKAMMIKEEKYAFPLKSLLQSIEKSKNKIEIIDQIDKVYRKKTAKEDAKWLINTIMSDIEIEQILLNKDWVNKYFTEHPRSKYFNWN